MRNTLKKMPNWKAPGPDGVQGYWLKNFKSAHESLRLHLSECLESATVPDWMTNGRTVLIQKEKSKGNVPSECLESATVPDWMTNGITVLIPKGKIQRKCTK